MFRIKFLRNILFISLLIAVVLPLYNIFFAYPSFVNLLTENIEDDAGRVGHHLSSTILFTDDYELTTDFIGHDFIMMVEEVVRDFRLVKFQVFSKSGEVLYSTEPLDIGEVNEQAYFYDMVAKGNRYSKVVRKGGKSLEGQRMITDVVETYVPIMKDGEFMGAFEIYYDITASKAALNKELLRSSLIQMLVALSLIIILIFALRKAKLNIEEREVVEAQVQQYKDRLQILISQLSTLEDQERKDISEEMHENIGQYLALSKIKLSRLIESNPEIKNDLDEIRKYIDETIDFTRSLTFELSSPILYQLGLEQALEWLTAHISSKHSIHVDLVSDNKLKGFKGEISLQLYKTIHELLLNVVKHADAENVVVYLLDDGENIDVSVKDDGKGFDVAEVEAGLVSGKSFGLFNIRERIVFNRGTFDITSKKEEGTIARVVVPKHKRSDL